MYAAPAAACPSPAITNSLLRDRPVKPLPVIAASGSATRSVRVVFVTVPREVHAARSVEASIPEEEPMAPVRSNWKVPLVKLARRSGGSMTVRNCLDTAHHSGRFRWPQKGR